MFKDSVTKIFSFDAAHRLYNYEGKCHNLHGHTWKVEVTLSGPLNENGMVVDFNDMDKKIGKMIDEKFDHATILNINDPLLSKIRLDTNYFGLSGDPTSENLAKFIYREVKAMFEPIAVTSVVVWESPTSHAEYRET